LIYLIFQTLWILSIVAPFFVISNLLNRIYTVHTWRRRFAGKERWWPRSTALLNVGPG